MAETKHTEGEWRYGGQHSRSRGLIKAGMQTEGEPLGIKTVAVVAQDATLAGGDPEANGRLIAAAPALLAACKEALTLPLVEALGLAGGPYVEQLLLNAIAKAEGK